jgi:hypothetical protein
MMLLARRKAVKRRAGRNPRLPINSAVCLPGLFINGAAGLADTAMLARLYANGIFEHGI